MTKPNDSQAVDGATDCSDVACDTCGLALQSDGNSFWCDNCQRLWPRDYVENAICDECDGDRYRTEQDYWDNAMCHECDGTGRKFKPFNTE